MDFTWKKDTSTEQHYYMVFFKSRDTAAIAVAFQEFASRKLGQDEKPSNQERLVQAKEEAAQNMECRALNWGKVKVKERSVEL